MIDNLPTIEQIVEPKTFRVYEWSRIFGVRSKDTIEVLRNLGLPARSYSSKIELPAVKARCVMDAALRRQQNRKEALLATAYGEAASGLEW